MACVAFPMLSQNNADEIRKRSCLGTRQSARWKHRPQIQRRQFPVFKDSNDLTAFEGIVNLTEYGIRCAMRGHDRP
jgi:hypothetical protein